MNGSENAGVAIRRATPADARILARMRASSAFERHGGTDAERAEYERVCSAFFAARLAQEDSFLRSWIASRAEQLAGGASLALFPTLPRYGEPFNGTDGRVRDVYVVPAFRRTGVARALMDVILAEARSLRIDRLSLGASAMGRPLYESLGFVGKLDEMVYEPPVELA
jgi:GNAT superfamily N-acetyltransferase